MAHEEGVALLAARIAALEESKAAYEAEKDTLDTDYTAAAAALQAIIDNLDAEITSITSSHTELVAIMES